jgi:hypothetical protein
MAVRRFDEYSARWARPLTASSGTEAAARAALLAAKDLDQWTAQSWSVDGLACECESSVAAVVANRGVYGFAANQPRIGPGSKGLLVHEPRTYHLAPTRDLSASADWTKSQVTATDNAYQSPDGDTQATKILPSNVSGNHYLSTDVTVENETRYTFAAFIHNNPGDSIIGFNVTIGLTSGDVTDQWRFSGSPDADLDGDWQRWSTSFTTGAADAGTVTITLDLVYSGDTETFAGDETDDFVHIWGVTLAQGYESGVYSINTSRTGLLSAYDFDGDSLADIKGTNDGTSSGTITFGNSRYGATISPGAAAYVDTGIDSTQIDPAHDDHSVSVWFKVDSLPTENALIAGKGYGVGDNWTYPPQAALIVTPAGNLRFDFYDSSNFTHRYVETAINTGQWYHAVYTVDHTANTAYLYLDGSSVGSVGYVTDMSADADTTAVNMYIGGHEGDSVCQESFSGEITNVEFYTTVLASGTVSGMYDEGKLAVDLGPYVQADELGAGVTAEAPKYTLTDADILRPLNAGRIALRVDFSVEHIPSPAEEATEKIPILTLYQDASNYIELYLRRQENGGSDYWKLYADDGTSDASAWAAAGTETEIRVWFYLYEDGSGTLRMVDTSTDTVIEEETFTDWTFNRMTFTSIKLGSEPDGTGQRHISIKELVTW